ncbi:MAG TPA: hypothetical protein VI299_10350 [Polyangiales bacterium]
MNMLSSDLTLLELANAIAEHLSLAFAEPWSVSLPSVPSPHEVWLHGQQRKAAALRVVAGSLEAWFDGVRQACPVECREQLEEGCRWAVRAVHRQHALFAQNLDATRRAWEWADQLVALLRGELPELNLRVHRLSSASHAASGYAQVYAGDPPRVVAEVSAERGELALHAGPEGQPMHYSARVEAGIDRSRLVRAIREQVLGERPSAIDP